MDTADGAPETLSLCYIYAHSAVYFSFTLYLHQSFFTSHVVSLILLEYFSASLPLPFIPSSSLFNKLVCHSTLIAFFLSFCHQILLLFFVRPDMIYVCPPFFTHMCTHALLHTSPPLILSILSGSAPVC